MKQSVCAELYIYVRNNYRRWKWTRRLRILVEAACISHINNTLGKRMNARIPSRYGLTLGWTGSFKIAEFKPVKLR